MRSDNPNHKPLRYPSDWSRRKERNEKISLVTCYDATSAKLISHTPIDAILVGDSLGMVVQGERSTLPVTMEQMLYHCRMVRRGAPDAFIIGDLPFGSYQISLESAMRNGVALMQDAQMSAIKVEGADNDTLRFVEKAVRSGIPVMGHIGLTPQSYMNLGGFRVQGRSSEGAALLRQALADLTLAGVFAVVLEYVKSDLTSELSQQSGVPLIGIGSGVDCDGQVLVLHDLLGFDLDFRAKHARRYAELGAATVEALRAYHSDVQNGSFPGPEESFKK